MIPTEKASALINSGEVVDSDGDSIGKVGTVYVDDTDGHLTWVTVKTGYFGTSESFVPLDDATLNEDTITVPYSKDKVKDAPNFDADASLSPEEEDQLYTYYGISGQTTVSDVSTSTTGDASDAYGATTDTAGVATTGYAGTDTEVVPAAAAAAEPATTATTGTAGTAGTGEGYVTRSEEQLNVGTRKVETGRARLKKYVVTEQQTVTVPVSHEEVTLVREPIAADEVTDATIGEDEIEVVLTQDQVVVDKQAVAVEKIRLDTDTVTEHQDVTEDIRKEQVELDTSDIADRLDDTVK